ncbi:MAG: hypothetical protein E7513_04535 [Ruminococcaceae bacterium]|nr:hypothetical protein [Oscillospiraceae bacterium]
MNKINFDSLKNLKAPESWIENAANIPQTVEKEKPVLIFFLKHSRSLATVACLVLICSVSLTIYLTQDRNVLPIDLNYGQAEATQKTHSPTDYSSDNQNSNESIIKETQSNNETAYIEPTEKADSNPSQNHITDNTDDDNGTNGGAPHEDSTQSPTQKPTDKPTTSPSVKPTVNSTANPTITPSVKPTTPEPTIPRPTFPDLVEPTYNDELPGAIPITSYMCYGESSVENIINNQVYCKIFDSADNQLGDSDLFSKEHHALVEKEKDKACFGYDPLYLGLIKEVGTHRFVFYNKKGDTLCEGYFDIDFEFEEFGLGALIPKDSGENFYCFVFDPDGIMLGDSELFTKEREAVISHIGQNIIGLEYYPGKIYNMTKLGIYTYAFYNSQGTLLFQSWANINY